MTSRRKALPILEESISKDILRYSDQEIAILSFLYFWYVIKRYSALNSWNALKRGSKNESLFSHHFILILASSWTEVFSALNSFLVWISQWFSSMWCVFQTITNFRFFFHLLICLGKPKVRSFEWNSIENSVFGILFDWIRKCIIDFHWRVQTFFVYVTLSKKYHLFRNCRFWKLLQMTIINSRLNLIYLLFFFFNHGLRNISRILLQNNFFSTTFFLCSFVIFSDNTNEAFTSHFKSSTIHNFILSILKLFTIWTNGMKYSICSRISGVFTS